MESPDFIASTSASIKSSTIHFGFFVLPIAVAVGCCDAISGKLAGEIQRKTAKNF